MNVRRIAPAAEINNALDAAIAQGRNLTGAEENLDVQTLYAGFQTWDKRNQLVLESSFDVRGVFTTSPKSDYVDFRDLKIPFGQAPAEGLTVAAIRADVETKIRRLESLKSNLDLYQSTETGESASSSHSSKPTADGARATIFIIHGQDEAVRLQVQNLLLRVTDHKPIVLMEQVNRGATIIEKLDEHLGEKAAFAVAIITGDDHGAVKSSSELAPRARQNVILELGYAMGKIGRRNVALLYEPGVELPSDMYGVAYYPLDSGGAWKTSLAGELAAAGLDVKLEGLLG